MSFLSQTKPGIWSTMEGTFTYRSRPLFLSRTIGEPAEDYDSFFFFRKLENCKNYSLFRWYDVVGSVNSSVKK